MFSVCQIRKIWGFWFLWFPCVFWLCTVMSFTVFKSFASSWISFCLLPSSFYPELCIAVFADAVLVRGAVNALCFGRFRFHFAGLCGGEVLMPHWRLPGAQWPPTLWKDDIWYKEKRRDTSFSSVEDAREPLKDSQTVGKTILCAELREPGSSAAVGVFLGSLDRETGKPTPEQSGPQSLRNFHRLYLCSE